MKAEPDAFLQLLQWQTKAVKGSPVKSYLIDWQRQEPWRTFCLEPVESEGVIRVWEYLRLTG